jgi:hypothetical protein
MNIALCEPKDFKLSETIREKIITEAATLSTVAKNLINPEFNAEKPNTAWFQILLTFVHKKARFFLLCLARSIFTTTLQVAG